MRILAVAGGGWDGRVRRRRRAVFAVGGRDVNGIRIGRDGRVIGRRRVIRRRVTVGRGVRIGGVQVGSAGIRLRRVGAGSVAPGIERFKARRRPLECRGACAGREMRSVLAVGTERPFHGRDELPLLELRPGPGPVRAERPGRDVEELRLGQTAPEEFRVRPIPGGEVDAEPSHRGFELGPRRGLECQLPLDRTGYAGREQRFLLGPGQVPQRPKRLGNAAPELLDAYRAGEMGLQALQAFCVTADEARQRAVWEELKAQHHGPSVWQIRRILTEGRMPATSAVATFVGTEAYEAAGGALTRDLFAEEDERGTWFDDPVLLRNLALEKLETVAEELRTKWAWAEARVEVDWNDTARFARIRPKPGQATAEEAEEAKEVQTLTARRDELTELDDDAWTGETESELGRIEARLDAIQQSVADRAVFRRKDREIAGAIATVGDDGTLRLIQGLVRPEDIPAAEPTGSEGPDDGYRGTRRRTPRFGAR